jgi:hypothetical protein
MAFAEADSKRMSQASVRLARVQRERERHGDVAGTECKRLRGTAIFTFHET